MTSCPLLYSVQAGFPSPVEYAEKLNLHELLVKNKASTFFMKAEGDSMVEAGIFSGDILVVDRSLMPLSGLIVVATVDGEFTVKRFVKKGRETVLAAESAGYRDICVSPESDFSVFGVVTSTVHFFR